VSSSSGVGDVGVGSDEVEGFVRPVSRSVGGSDVGVSSEHVGKVGGVVGKAVSSKGSRFGSSVRSEAETVVNIHIGRIEVRAVREQEQSKLVGLSKSSLSLSEYLKQRSEEKL